MTWELYTGDCLEVLPTLPDGIADAIITDLPYGTTACSWDEVIPFEPMWAQVRRLLKPRGAFVTTASQPFTSKLVMSNAAWFKYEWVWEKDQVTNPQLAKFMPLRNYENVIVFGAAGVDYNPQHLRRTHNMRGVDKAGVNLGHLSESKAYVQEFTNYPRMIIRFNSERGLHPTQKPVALYEYLIRTYTNEGDTVLDFTCGSGTTGVAAINTGRNFIGVELRENYADIARARCEKAAEQARQLELI